MRSTTSRPRWRSCARSTPSGRSAVAQLGLDPPTATITLRTAHRQVVLRLGAPNASGGSVYAERPGHPRIFLVGTGLLSALERVFYQADQLTRTQ